MTKNWADHHGKVWVVCGPVFLQKKPRLWLGELGEKPVAGPDWYSTEARKKARFIAAPESFIGQSGELGKSALRHPSVGVSDRSALR